MIIVGVGCHRILTSGGAPNVLTCAYALARFVTQATDRIQIAAGHFHGSLQQAATNSGLRLPVSVADIRRLTHTAKGQHPRDYECWLGIYAGPWFRGPLRKLTAVGLARNLSDASLWQRAYSR
jgi:hypothetical protein